MPPPNRSWRGIFKFAKPKTPGYEISKDYYLSVLSSTPTLPRLREVMHPKGEEGAVPGYLAPMGTADKGDLDLPLQRGVFALASPDQKTVLKLMIMPRDEAGFDPEPFLASPVAADFPTEVRHRVAATWHVMQLTFEAFDPTIGPALDFFLVSGQRLAQLTDGVVADPICQRYLLPQDVIQRPRLQQEFDVREHIVVRHNGRSASAHTLGWIKFGLPEIEITGLEPSELELAESFLQHLGQVILRGHPLKVGGPAGPFMVSHGGMDRGRWEGIPVFELLPPAGKSTAQALAEWARDAGL